MPRNQPYCHRGHSSHGLLPITTPPVMFRTHCNRRSRWINIREILRREIFTCSPCDSKRRPTVKADNDTPVIVLQRCASAQNYGAISLTAMQMRCLGLCWYYIPCLTARIMACTILFGSSFHHTHCCVALWPVWASIPLNKCPLTRMPIMRPRSNFVACYSVPCEDIPLNPCELLSFPSLCTPDSKWSLKTYRMPCRDIPPQIRSNLSKRWHRSSPAT